MMQLEVDISHVISKRLTVSKFNIMRHEDLIRDTITYELLAMFAGSHQDPFIFKYPLTWWQHFKQSCFPGWLKRRFPVMEKETKLSITMLYPHLKAKIPKDLMGPSFTVMVNGVNQCRFVNGDTYSDLSTYEQIERCYDKPMFNPDDKRCPTCRKEIGYP